MPYLTLILILSIVDLITRHQEVISMESPSFPVLAPSRVMDIVDRTFRIYRNNFLAFAGLVALVILPLTLLATAISSNTVTLEEAETWQEYSNAVREQALKVGSIALVQQFLLAVVVNAAVIFVASESLLGRNIPVGKAFRHIKGRLLPLIGALLLIIIVFGLLLVITSLLTSICIVPIVIIPVILYYALALYFFLMPVMVLERTGPGLGANRALYLGRARFWPTLGFAFAIWLVTAVINTALGSVGGLVGATSFEGANTLETAIGLAVTIFITPIMPIGLTLMYYDARIRIEGLDFALQAVDSPEPRPSDVFSPSPTGRLFTGSDLANAFLLTVGVIALGCGMYALLALLVGVST
jgi:hypothetical protein